MTALRFVDEARYTVVHVDKMIPMFQDLSPDQMGGEVRWTGEGYLPRVSSYSAPWRKCGSFMPRVPKPRCLEIWQLNAQPKTKCKLVNARSTLLWLPVESAGLFWARD